MPRKTHEENLATVCCVCGRKGNKYRNVTDDLALKVQLIHPSYDRSGGIHPTAICSTCRNALSELEKDPEQTRRRIPGKLDYSTIRGPGVSTRAKTDAGCSCSICSIGGLGVNDEKKWNSQISNPLGRPAGEVEKMETDDATPNLNISIKTCEYCRAEIRQGVKHVCNQTERRRNLAEQLRTSSQGTLETVLGEGLKEALRRDEELASSDSTHGKDQLSLKSRFGGASPLTVTVGKGRTREFRQLTIQDFLQVKKSLGLSCVQTKKLAFHIRAGTRNRKAVESGLAEALAESNILLDDLFTAEEVLVENKEGEGEEKTLVYCNDISELVLRLLEYRGLDPNTTDAKLGLDKGQGSVKVTVNVVQNRKDTRNPSEYRDFMMNCIEPNMLVRCNTTSYWYTTVQKKRTLEEDGYDADEVNRAHSVEKGTIGRVVSFDGTENGISVKWDSGITMCQGNLFNLDPLTSVPVNPKMFTE